MSSTTLRHYNATLSYSPRDRERKLREFKKRFRTRMSRRRVKQNIRTALSKLNLA